MMKKLLSMVLCLAMCLSMFPTASFAEESQAEPAIVSADSASASVPEELTRTQEQTE